MFIKSVSEDRTTHKHLISDNGYYKTIDSGLTDLNAIVEISIQSEDELKRLQSLIGATIDIEEI
tara:strand:- start:368 stop:559 length:192 start_codon:yes stop_codon:yes gene_type:complete